MAEWAQALSQAWAGAFAAIQQLMEDYPNYSNGNMPHAADCNIEDNEEMKIPFRRIMPSIFQINTVDHMSNRYGCTFVVTYSLADHADLPTGQGIKDLIQRLKKFTPSNAIIIHDCLKLPKDIQVTYAVACSCTRIDFELPALKNMKIQV